MPSTFQLLAFPQGGNNIPSCYYASPEGKPVLVEACKSDCESDVKCDTILWHSCFKICKKYATGWKPGTLADPCCDVYRKVITPPGSSSLSTAFLLCFCVYIILGVGAGYAKEGRPRHIHAKTWHQIHELCADGLAFARSGGEVGRPRKTTSGDGRISAALVGAENPPRGKKGKKEKKDEKDTQGKVEHRPSGKNEGIRKSSSYTTVPKGKGSGAAESEGRLKHERGVTQPLGAAPAAAAGTQAGDGGRWVHISS